MTSKFEIPHAEIKLYLPLHDLHDIQDLRLADLLNQGQVKVHKPKKRKGVNNAQTHQ